MKMTKRDIAGYLGIDYKTLFNWEKIDQIYIKQLCLDLWLKRLQKNQKKALKS